MRLPIFIIKPLRPILGDVPTINIRDTKLTTFPRSTDNYGRWGMLAFNADYFCVWGMGKWHKISVARMPSHSWGKTTIFPGKYSPHGDIELSVVLV